MPHFNNIVVCTDFSDCSKAAFRQGARLARVSSATLHIIHVVQQSVVRDLAESYDGNGTFEADLLEQVRGDLSKLLETMGVSKALTIRLHALIGEPLEEIQKVVESVNAELVIMGVFGAEGESEGAGSLASKAVRRLPTEVMLVQLPHDRAFERIVACIDFSATSGRALRDAVRVAAHDNAEIHALHVFQGPWHALHYRSPTSGSSPAFQEQYRQRLLSRLNTFVEEQTSSLARGPAISCDLLDYSNYGKGIVSFAAENNADLVVLGTEGHTNLRYLFLGSTAERVLRELPCSILTIKPRQHSIRTAPDEKP